MIGSGMGGMACGALLADFGKRVLIVEQHYVPGGMTHVFQRQGYTWDVGVHAVGEVSSDGRFGRLVQRLGRGRVEWVSLGPVCDEFHYPDGRQIDVADSPEKMARNLRAAFPDQRESIDRYLGRVCAVAAGMQDHFLGRAFGRRLATTPSDDLGGQGIDHWIHQRTGDVLRSLTDDDELIAVLSAQWGYYGADPM
ncbi:MAG: NAD(P)-binding protein, partial [Myxococcota bacterium]|nr:NAD(P)-binding protein [Myxococcota bacterium]